jgi:hypothetical protein
MLLLLPPPLILLLLSPRIALLSVFLPILASLPLCVCCIFLVACTHSISPTTIAKWGTGEVSMAPALS